MATAGNLKKGEFIKYQGSVWQIQKTEFYSPGKGSALMRTRIRDVKSGKNIDFTFKSQEQVETVEVSSSEMQYLYKDSENAHFMDNQTFQQYQIPLELIGDVIQYFKEGETMYVYVHEDTPINIRPPLVVQLRVEHTPDAVKGDTVSGARKKATLETGAVVQVPLFVKTGDIITVNPETGEYGERAK